MNAQWDQIQKLFDACAELAPARQVEFLTDECNGDEAVQAQVKLLLKIDRENATDGFLDWPDRTASNPQQLIETGSRVGDYLIDGLIGSGSFGEVYRATRVGRQDAVAIKVMRPWQNDSTAIARFEREAEALGRLAHPNIAALIETGVREDGLPFIVMELIDGAPLSQISDSDVEFDIETKIDWFLDICRAIAAAHEVQILHRDLKPSNILVDKQGKAVVTDFGLARFFGDASRQTHLTTTGRSLGTPRYMAPEQFNSSTRPGMTTDVYGLGGILYFLLTGNAPFESENIFTIAGAVQDQQPTDPRSINKKVTTDLATVCLHCLHKKPEDRYCTVSELIGDIERAQARKPISVRPVSRFESLVKWTARNPAIAILCCLSVLSLVIGLLTTSYFWQRAENRTRQLLSINAKFSQFINLEESKAPTLKERHDLLLSIVHAYEELEQDARLDDETHYSMAVTWFKLGRIQHFLAFREQSNTSVQRAEQGFRTLIERHPGNLEYQFDLFHSLICQERTDEAYTVIQKVVKADEAKNDHYFAAFSNALRYQSMKSQSKGKFLEAIEYSKRGLKVSQASFGSWDAEPKYRRGIGIHLEDIATAYFVLKRFDEASKHILESIEIGEWVCEKEPAEVSYYLGRVMRLKRAIAIFLETGGVITARNLISNWKKTRDSRFRDFEEYPGIWDRSASILTQIWLFENRHGTDKQIEVAQNELHQHLQQYEKAGIDPDRSAVFLAEFLSHPKNDKPDFEYAMNLVEKAELTMHGTLGSAGTVATRCGRLEMAADIFDEYQERYPDKMLGIKHGLEELNQAHKNQEPD